MIRNLCLFALLLSCSLTQAALDPKKDPQYCGGCHQRIYKEWKSSRMGQDLNNPVVYQFYTGTNGQGKKDGLGFQPFTHGAKGDCADCHVPELVLDKHAQGEEVDLGVAMKEKLDFGISCAFCHSIEDVHVKKGDDGRYKTRIFDTVTMDKSGAKHGPLESTVPLELKGFPTKVNPLFKESRLCAVCHLNQEKFLSISTYDDWKKAYDAGKTDQTCQGCHMPLLEGKQEIAVGVPEREGMRSHTFIGAHDQGMLAKALSLKLDGKLSDGKLVVTSIVENVGAGHKVPGSGPIRNVILKIDVTDKDGHPLKYAGDKRGLLPPLAGFGNPKTHQRDDNDWAGLPGKMYAKVYRSKPIPKMGNKPMVGVGGFAADAVVFDTALKPKEPDQARFTFEAPEGKGPYTIKARLVYRDAFKPLSDRKGWKLQQREMVSQELTVEGQAGG